MESKDVLVKLREQRGLSQQELADQLHVTRQAVSRWERGETTPNPETLKQLSALLHVSINTLLGAYLSECTMEEMAETCADIMAQEGVPREAALAHMNQVLPTLDRWRRDS